MASISSGRLSIADFSMEVDFDFLGADRRKRRHGLAVVVVALGFALFPWTITRYLPPNVDGSSGNMISLFQVVLRFGSVFFGPVLVVVAAMFALVGPIIERHHERLSVPFGTECDMTRTKLDGFDERLRTSRNSVEKNTFFHGVHPTLDLPILIDEKHFFEHCHVLGPSGIGKTVLGLTGRVMQHIRRNNSAILIIDGKGDEALFAIVRAEAAKAGRVFKHFTSATGKSTHVFNPIDARVMGALSIGQRVGILQNALGLVHGEDYGEFHHGQEVDGQFLEAGTNAAAFLQPADRLFDDAPTLVGFLVERRTPPTSRSSSPTAVVHMIALPRICGEGQSWQDD